MVLLDIFNRLKRPPDKEWKFQRQSIPPNFGWARLVDRTSLEKEVEKRRDNSKLIIDNSKDYCDFKKGKISLIVLSCRRYQTLKRLIDTMKGHLGKREPNLPIEKILVDNGSGRRLIEDVMHEDFFDRVIAHPENLGMVGALKDAYRKAEGEYIIFIEDDFILDYQGPFLDKCVSVFKEFPEIGIIRLKDQNNWWKPHRIIAPIRETKDGVEFWTWLPSRDGMLNVWCAGSVIFRKVSYFSTGELPDAEDNLPRKKKFHQGYIYECIYAKEYNRGWLAAKMKDCYPFFQPNLNEESRGWEE